MILFSFCAITVVKQAMILFSFRSITVVKQLQECIIPWYLTQTTNNTLRRTDNLAKREPGNPLSFFFRIYLEKRRKGSPHMPPGHDSIQPLCKYLGKTSIGTLAFAYGHSTVAVECPRSRSNWCSQVFDTNPNPHTETYRRSDNLAHSN